MQRKNRPPTLGAIAIGRLGWRNGGHALTFMACWWITTRSLGRPPETIDEYSDWWKQSRAKGFREQAQFRLAFPEYSDPMALAAAIGFNPYKSTEDKVTLIAESFQMAWAA